MHPYLLGLAGLVVAVGSVMVGYSLGLQHGLTRIGASAEQVAQLREDLQKQTSAVSTLSQTLTSTTQERDLAVDNNERLTTEMAKVTDGQELAAARQQSLIDWINAHGGAPLAIRAVDIKPLPQQAFEYHIDLMAISDSKKPVSGTLELYLIDGDTLMEVPVNPARFTVRGFERLVGRWTMPKDARPQFIEVRVKGGREPIVQRFAWESGDVIKDMPSSLADVPMLTEETVAREGAEAEAEAAKESKAAKKSAHAKQ